MTENKRFEYNVNKNSIEYDNEHFAYCNVEQNKITKKLNELHDGNIELKRELLIYRRIASCGNCAYLNYDWFEDGDEFEICEKGNNEQQISYHICKDWREL